MKWPWVILERCSRGQREVAGEHEEKTERRSSLPEPFDRPEAKVLTSDRWEGGRADLGDFNIFFYIFYFLYNSAKY